MLSDTELYYTVLSHQEAMRQVRERVTSFVMRRWGSLSAWRDSDIQAFVNEIVPVVEAGQRTIYRLTDTYLTTIALGMGDKIPPAIKAATVNFRGLSGKEVYLRPGSTIYNALAEGKSLDEAVRLGTQRLQDLISTDLQLAQTHAVRDTAARSQRIVGVQRVLTGAENCLLCTIASTQRYSARYAFQDELQPIHPGCDCTWAPIYGDRDPGQVINQERYAEVKALQDAIGVDTHSWSGEQYEKWMENRDATRVTIREHGEYGPTLTWANQSFTGPSDV